MPDLTFQVMGATAAFSAVSLLVEIVNAAPQEKIESISLRCQVNIETPRRRYSADEQIRLFDLFGEPARWGQTLRPILWANVATSVPAFSGETSIELALPCAAGPRVAASRYLQSLDGGLVPITLLFSGIAFYLTADGRVQIAPIPWDREARFSIPVEVWKESIGRAMEAGV